MNKELQNLAWSVLPKEYREEVKKLYDRFLFTREGYYDELFGKHNLTSDAEGEEMLTVSRKQVQEMYADIINDIRDYNGENPEMVGTTDPILRERAAGMKAQLHRLFGEHNLASDTEPDEVAVAENATTTQPKPAEPKSAEPQLRFKEYDTVRVKKDCKSYNELVEIMAVDEYDESAPYFGDDGEWYAESDLEPYTEPEKEYLNLSKNIADCNKQFDNILKGSFCDHNRLHIAAMAMHGILSNIDLFKNVLGTGMETLDGEDISYRAVAKASFLFADALIAESEKGGPDGN